MSRQLSSSSERTPPHLPEPDPIELATRALGRADRSRHQVDERLARAGVGDAERARALETLERLGYVDDRRLATGRAGTLADRGHGDEAIRFDLERRGLSPGAIEEALASLQPEASRAAGLAERLGRTAKTAAQLRRKGFSEDALESAIGDGIAAGGP